AVVPAARPSPSRVALAGSPAPAMRWAGVRPSREVWSTYPRADMSADIHMAAAVRVSETTSAGRPRDARRSLIALTRSLSGLSGTAAPDGSASAARSAAAMVRARQTTVASDLTHGSFQRTCKGRSHRVVTIADRVRVL